MSEENTQEVVVNGEYGGEVIFNGGQTNETSEIGADLVGQVKDDDDSKKLFVGGLSWETTEDDLKTYFGQWGTVISCNVKLDKMTGNSRGFGFVSMDSEESVKNVVSQGQHYLKNKKIDPKPAKPTSVALKKIFVGGLKPEVTEDQIKEYFFQFGPVESMDLPFDNFKGKRKPYIFLTFVTEEAARQAVLVEKQDVCGSMFPKQLEKDR